MAAISSMTVLAAAAAVTAVAAVGGAISAQKQASAQKDAIKAQQRSASVQAAAERVKAIREARIARAAMISESGKSGVGFESSGVIGAESSIGSQLGANIGMQNVQLGFADMASKANQRAASAASQGAMWQAVGSISGSIFQAKGGWTSIFGGNTIPQVGTGSFGSGTGSKALGRR